MKTLQGRVAVITGAASGIGLAVTEAFAAHDMKVVMSDVAGDLLDAEVTRLRGAGAEVSGHLADVRDPDALEGLAATAVSLHGGINVAVNNAGVVNMKPSWELTLDEWRQVLDINLFGVIHGVRAFVPRILAAGSEGHVINIGSRASVTAIPNLAPYTVAKHGVLAISDVLRAEMKQIGAPVGVSVVMPGRVNTRLNPIGHIPASQVAANVVDAMLNDRPYVFTDHDGDRDVTGRLDEIRSALDQVIEPS